MCNRVHRDNWKCSCEQLWWLYGCSIFSGMGCWASKHGMSYPDWFTITAADTFLIKQVGLQILQDIYFEHERGEKMGYWTLAIDLGSLFVASLRFLDLLRDVDRPSLWPLNRRVCSTCVNSLRRMANCYPLWYPPARHDFLSP